MKFLADANLERVLVAWLLHQGHDVTWAVDLPPSTADDEILATGPWEGRGELARQCGYHLREDDDTGAVELIRAEEDQRSRIARELHDGVGQIMTAVNIELQLLHEATPKDLKARVEAVFWLGYRSVSSNRHQNRRRRDPRSARICEIGVTQSREPEHATSNASAASFSPTIGSPRRRCRRPRRDR